MWLCALFNAFATWRRYRTTVHQLAALDTRMLRDIGLDRTQLARTSWDAAKR